MGAYNIKLAGTVLAFKSLSWIEDSLLERDLRRGNVATTREPDRLEESVLEGRGRKGIAFHEHQALGSSRNALDKSRGAIRNSLLGENHTRKQPSTVQGNGIDSVGLTLKRVAQESGRNRKNHFWH